MARRLKRMEQSADALASDDEDAEQSNEYGSRTLLIPSDADMMEIDDLDRPAVARRLKSERLSQTNRRKTRAS